MILFLISANYWQGGDKKTPKGEECVSVQKCFWIFEWNIKVTVIAVIAVIECDSLMTEGECVIP